MSAVIESAALSIEDLCEALALAKRAEAEANARRVAAEEALIAATGFDKPEGSSTVNVGEFKLTITAKLTRKIDWTRYDQIEASIPEALRPVKIERKLDEPGVKYLQANEPALYKALSKALTVTPAKTAVTISRVA